MKDKFYGDKRDLVKWGGIVQLCHKNGIKTVLQVAYYRKDEWGEAIDFNGRSIPLSGAVIKPVIKHFRDIKDIIRLGNRANLDIQVFHREFNKDRKKYHDKVCEKIKGIDKKKVVFLDPDTGIAPKKCEAKHVAEEEIGQIWKSLNPGDYLVFYQHKPQFKKNNWREKHRLELANSCEVHKSRVQKWSADEISNDVVFYFMERRKEDSG